MNVRGPPRIKMIFPRIGAGPDGHEAVVPPGICQGVSATCEIWIERSVMLIHSVQIPARSVALPDFDQRMWHGFSILIDHPASHDDPFTQWFACMLFR